MDRPLKEILGYIKSFFGTNPLENSRKRKSSLHLDSHTSPKVSKLSTKSPTRIIPIEREEGSSSYFWRTPPNHKKSPLLHGYRTSLMNSSKPDRVVVIDDEEDTNLRGRQMRKKPTGFASNHTDNAEAVFRRGNFDSEDEDVVLVKTYKPAKEATAYIDAMTSKWLSDKPLFTIGTGHQTASTSNGRNNSSKRNRSSILDYSYRLDDKMMYRKLLEQANNNGDSSGTYHTPPLIHSFTSSRLSSGKVKSPLFDVKHKSTPKERVVKVSDCLRTEPAIIKDSDSDDSVVIIDPPSPKPDFKVDPINSFKKIVDCSNTSKKDWLDEIVEKHKESVSRRQKEIDDLRQVSDETGEINNDIKLELIRRKISDCLQLKEILIPEIVLEPESELPELTEQHHEMVKRAFKGDPNEVLASKFSLNITRRDLMTLAGLNWLNDEVINFYMNLIIDRAKDSSKWPRSYCFNTFFYSKLIKDGPQSLRRWTKRIDLFSFDLVCVPIHLGMHWCMAIIDFRDKSIRYYDSMGSPNSRCLHALKNYLEAEHLDKKGTAYDTKSFTLENMEDIPQQMNGSDCGMFACTFAEYITRNAKITFQQEDMPYFRKKMVVEIMSGELLIK